MAPSLIWAYCTKVNNGSKVKCDLCHKQFLFNKSTSTMMKHLQCAHKIAPPSSNEKQTQKRLNDSHNDFEVQPKKVLVAVESSVPSVALVPQTKSSVQENTTVQSQVQGPMDRCINNANSFSAGGRRYDQATTALLRMIAVDNMPLCTTERPGFRKFIKTLQPLYHIPCEPTITNAMSRKYQDLSNKIKLELRQTESVCLTTDIWTHQHTMKSYLGLTVHYLKETEMKTVELGAYLMEERKTIENLSLKLRNICNDWGLDDSKIAAFISDGGANIKGAIKSEFGDGKHISCFGHVINNIGQRLIEVNITPPASESQNQVSDLPADENDAIDNLEDLITDHTEQSSLRELLSKVKQIVTFFRQSERATTELLKLQKDKPENSRLKLIQEVRTRWNSCFEMVDRFIVLADHVSKVLLQVKMDKSSKAKPPNMITGEEIDALVEVRDILKPLLQVTQEVCFEKYVTLSKCIPLISSLRKKIEELTLETLIGRHLKQRMVQDIETKYGNIESVKLHACATLVDPRYKKFGFQSIRDSARAVTNVADLVKTERKVALAATVANINPQDEILAIQGPESQKTNDDNDDLWSYFDNTVICSSNLADSDEAGGLPIQLRQYLTRPAVNRKQNPNPFTVWESMKYEYPYLWNVAKKYLPIVATSVPCERLFSHAGLIANQLRSRLSPQHINELIFLRSIGEEMWFS
ncbi:zinc finger BED domain-containing protein 4-like [Bactrocera neohumeralis]|uniref:zinc finger BED domain-containing protein 4-like n=1 Tax=Bactrocera neohumeralis TaxID=98809 RepID=UPI002165DB5F|nr:zinc finger BED domain-containing protein 4-like [Bactrocera neohumeralis]